MNKLFKKEKDTNSRSKSSKNTIVKKKQSERFLFDIIGRIFEKE